MDNVAESLNDATWKRTGMDEDTVPKTAGLTAPEFDSLRFRS